MKLPRVRFTLRRMMIAVAVLALGLAGFQTVWQRWQERQHLRARIVIRQRLLNAIGQANNAVLEGSADYDYSPKPTADEVRNGIREAREFLRRAEEKVRKGEEARLRSQDQAPVGRH
jgi:hypothetical protein